MHLKTGILIGVCDDLFFGDNHESHITSIDVLDYPLANGVHRLRFPLDQMVYNLVKKYSNSCVTIGRLTIPGEQ